MNQMLSRRLGHYQATPLSRWTGVRVFRKSKTKRRAIRYSLLALNAVILLAVLVFVLKTPNTSKSLKQNALAPSTSNNIAANPIDQLSSADIAAHVANMTHLAESNSVSNYADSVNEQLSVAPADDKVIAKPQVINTTTKTRKDIQKYVVQSGDTVTSLASKFEVSSDSIRWSNNINGDSLTVGSQILISPVSNGVVYQVKKGDTPDTLADKYRTSKETIISFNDAEVTGLPVGQEIVIPDGTLPPPKTASAISFAGFAWGGFSPIYSSNGYDYGWCTWYAANRRAEIGRPVPSNLGNAYSWYRLAQKAGLPTGLTPAVGAVAVSEGGNHVSIVEIVNSNGSFVVSEMNSSGYDSIANIGNPAHAGGGWKRVDYKLIQSAGSLKFVY